MRTITAIASALCLLGLCLCMWGCSDDKINNGEGSGYIQPSVTVDPLIYSASEPSAAPIRISPLPEGSQFSITLTDLITDNSASWNSADDFPQSQRFLPGSYLLEAQWGSLDNEGIGTPCFKGSVQTRVNNSEVSKAEIPCTLANTVFQVSYSDNWRKYFPAYSAVLHSEGGAYVEVPSEENGFIFLRPGNISLILNLTLPSGENISFEPLQISDASPAMLYEASMSLYDESGDAPRVVVSFDRKVITDDVTVALTEAFIKGNYPAITPIGFTPGEPVEVAEGSALTSETGMSVSGRNLNALTLTTTSPSLIAAGWPAQINLLSLTPAQKELLGNFGFKAEGLYSQAGGEYDVKIDLSRVVSFMRSDDNNNRFCLMARDRAGRVSPLSILDVDVIPVDLSIVSVSSIIAGTNSGEIVVKCPASNLAENLTLMGKSGAGDWQELTVKQIEHLSNNNYVVRFDMKDDDITPTPGNPSLTSKVELRVYYCDILKLEIEINRVSPSFTIAVDAFANHATVRIETPDESLRSLITACAIVYGNGEKLTSVERFPQEGSIMVTGLQPDTRYRFQATLVDDKVPVLTEPVTVTTESVLQLPNADFEDVTNAIDYKNMLSGGRYTQNIVEIYNRQNRTSFTLSAPDGWANVNDKTFCLGATNHNTWYLAPSTYSVTEAYSGAYAVRLDNVGWDVDGSPIPDYRQTSLPYTPYSLNIPEIANRSTGRLFLGSYSFDPLTLSEVYDQGIAFSSRPLALNGFYMFKPAANNSGASGLVIVEVMGKDSDGHPIRIASGRTRLSTALTYTAFIVPLTYEQFGVKATSIKVMFASSTAMGTIEEETSRLMTVDDPATSTSRGSSLWIDNLVLSY